MEGNAYKFYHLFTISMLAIKFYNANYKFVGTEKNIFEQYRVFN